MEIVTVVSGGYTLFSFYDYYFKIKNLEKNDKFKDIIIKKYNNIYGLEINSIKENIEMPLYVNSGNIAIPIGNAEKKNEERFLLSKFIVRNSNIELENFKCYDKPSLNYFVNTNNDLEKIFRRFNIDNKKLLVKLPLRVEEYNLKNNVYTINNKNYGLIGTNRNKLVESFSFQTRKPFSISIGILSFIGFSYLLNDKIIKYI